MGSGCQCTPLPDTSHARKLTASSSSLHTACARRPHVQRGEFVSQVGPDPSGFQRVTQHHKFISSLPPSSKNPVASLMTVWLFFFFPRCSLSFVEWTPKNLALGLTVAYGRCCTYLSKLSAVLQPVGMPQEKIVSLLCERTWNSWSKTTFPLENLSQKRPHMCNDTSKSSPRLMTVSSACAFQNHREGWQHVDCSCCSCLGYASLLTCSHRWHCSLHLSLEGCDCNRLP